MLLSLIEYINLIKCQNNQKYKNDLKNFISSKNQNKFLNFDYYLNKKIKKNIHNTNFGLLYLNNKFITIKKKINHLESQKNEFLTSILSTDNKMIFDVLLALNLPNKYYYNIKDNSIITFEIWKSKSLTNQDNKNIKILYNFEDVTCKSHLCHDLCMSSTTNKCDYYKFLNKIKHDLNYLNNKNINPNQLCKFTDK